MKVLTELLWLLLVVALLAAGAVQATTLPSTLTLTPAP